MCSLLTRVHAARPIATGAHFAVPASSIASAGLEWALASATATGNIVQHMECMMRLLMTCTRHTLYLVKMVPCDVKWRESMAALDRPAAFLFLHGFR